MTEPVAEIIRLEDAAIFYEGPELCREYVRNEAIWFGTSTVQPGDVGATDPGHEGAWEVFYVVAGEGYIHDGENEHLLHAGDVLAVPPLIPHTIHNRSDAPVVMVWAGGPGTTSE